MDEQSVFSAALEIEDLDERNEYLGRVCGDDSELRERLEHLLEVHPQAGAFMAEPAAREIAPTLVAAERPGSQIGPYKLVEEIGEGGMGVVYMAKQEEPVRRKVALKIIKPGMDSRQVVSRFEAERQALAMMDHPNIARVFDGGATESGRPYFVMELVKGIPITEYCDRYRLTTDERLELFQDVCRAVQHAHQKGIIHRDLKPSNILVTLLDGRAIPKVIDFGIAKATGGDLRDESVATAFWQMVGTPMYMSPEQAELSAADVDTRSDVYSLGVLLYELLTGTTPFDEDRMSSVSFDEFRRIVREEDPPRPSTRLSTLDDDLDTVAEKRHTDARTLTQQVRGELDWIVMKAMEKHRTRRYESAADLAKDVQRYLDEEAVEACPPSARYRLGKFVCRNRAKVTVVATAVVSMLAALVLGLVFYAVAFRKEKALRQRAQHLQQRAETSELEARRTAYASDIMLAGRAWRDGDARQLVQLLDRQVPAGSKPDLRGFEWFYLRQLPRLRNFELTGHHGAAYFICCSPDGRWLATAGEDATIRLYDAVTRQIRTTIVTEQGEVNGLGFAPDGRTIASAGDDGTAKTWDLDTGRKVLEIAASSDELYNALYTLDGKLLITCGYDSVIRLWDARTGEQEDELTSHRRAVEAIALSPDGRLLASASSDETARIWDLERRTAIRKLTGHRGRLSSVAFSPDGKWVASGCLDKTVGIWDPANGELVTLLHHLDGVQCLAFEPEGRWLAAGDRGGVIRLWPRTWALPDWSFGSEGQVRWCGVSPDGRMVVAATSDLLT